MGGFVSPTRLTPCPPDELPEGFMVALDFLREQGWDIGDRGYRPMGKDEITLEEEEFDYASFANRFPIAGRNDEIREKRPYYFDKQLNKLISQFSDGTWQVAAHAWREDHNAGNYSLTWFVWPYFIRRL